MLIDFGYSCYMNMNRKEITACGTPNYIGN